MISNIRLLSEQQTQAFDVEYIDDGMFNLVKGALDKYISTDDFSFIDVGGGNGLYADRILFSFPSSNVIIVEPDEGLLGKNRRHSRKLLVKGTYQCAPISRGVHDVVGFNWVLHHFVGSNYSESLEIQREGLERAYQQLKPGGLLLVFENFYEGSIFHDLPGRLIYSLTASKALRPVTRQLGANTAGVGVSFHSENTWVTMIEQQGFNILSQSHCYDFGNLSALKKSILNIKKQRVGLIVAQK